jgi:hypothetical protein
MQIFVFANTSATRRGGTIAEPSLDCVGTFRPPKPPNLSGYLHFPTSSMPAKSRACRLEFGFTVRSTWKALQLPLLCICYRHYPGAASGRVIFACNQPCQPSQKGSSGRLRIVLFEACSAFTRVTACTLALSPIRDTLPEGFSYFVTSIAAPVPPAGAVTGWDLHPLESAALSRRTPNADIIQAPAAQISAPTTAPRRKSAAVITCRFSLMFVTVYSATHLHKMPRRQGERFHCLPKASGSVGDGAG